MHLYPKLIQDHLLLISPASHVMERADWGTTRERYLRVERYFYVNGSFIYYTNISPYYAKFTQEDGPIVNTLNQNFNIWTKLPLEVIDYCRDPIKTDTYIVFTRDGNYHHYKLNYQFNSFDPDIHVSTVDSVHFDIEETK